MGSPRTLVVGDEVWSIETVDGVSQAGPPLALRVFRDQRPCLACWTGLESSQPRLLFVERDASQWRTPEVVPTALGAEVSLALDAADRPWVAYYDLDQSALAAAQRTSSGWRTEFAARGLDAFTVGGLSLATVADAPAAVFWSDSGLQFARRAGPDSWRTEPVDPNGLSGIENSLAVAPGRFHTVYFDFGAHALRHASRSGGGWVRDASAVDSGQGGFAGEHCSLAIHPATGAPQTAYTSHLALHHARFEANAWNSSIVEIGSCTRPSLAISPGGAPHVLYFDAASNLRLARPGSAAQPVTLEAAAGTGGRTAIAIDGEGGIHAACSLPSRRTILYAATVPPPRALILPTDSPLALFNGEVNGSASTGDGITFAWRFLELTPRNPVGLMTGAVLRFPVSGPPGSTLVELTVTDRHGRTSSTNRRIQFV